MATDIREAEEAGTEKPVIKPLKGYQTNCDEKNEKGKPCWGPLKIWHAAPAEMRQQFPQGEMIYRCQQCWQIYHGLPHAHLHRGGTGA